MDVQNRKVGGLEAASTDDVGNRVGAGVSFLAELRDCCSSNAKRRRDDLGTEARQPLNSRQYVRRSSLIPVSYLARILEHLVDNV